MSSTRHVLGASTAAHPPRARALPARLWAPQLWAVAAFAAALAASVLLGAPAVHAFPIPDAGPSAGGTAVTVPVPGADSFLKVSSGASHSLAIDAEGNVWGWGDNADGQVGTIVAAWNLTRPHQVTFGLAFNAIAAGTSMSFALDEGGDLWAWGDEVNGQLGNGSTTGDVTTPHLVAAGTSFTAIAAGTHFAIALDPDGNLWTWGSDDAGQLGNGAATGDVTTPQQITTGTAFTAIAAGGSHSLALDAAGNLWTWGSDDAGQLGNGAAVGDIETPQQAAVATSFTSIAAGESHSLALDAAGGLWAWGSDTYGQAGNGATTGDVTIPSQITPGAGATFSAVSAGALHSLAVDESGNVWTWGNDGNGQLGNGATGGDVTTPQPVTAGSEYSAVSAGAYSNLGLDAEGSVWAWGNDSFEQMGNGIGTAIVVAPQRITENVTYAATAAGGQHSLALDARGDVWGWGNNAVGQVGSGAASQDVTFPRRVTDDTAYTAIAAGTYHSLAVDADGDLWSWGADTFGQLGNGGTTGVVAAPVRITTGIVYTAVAAGEFFSLALDADGNVWAWGLDNVGQVGNGAPTGDVEAPVQVTTGTEYTRIAAAGYHSLALDADGDVWSWGLDTHGQLGNGAPTGNVTAPEQATTGTPYSAIAAGERHSLAIDADANVWAWGSGAPNASSGAPEQITSGTAYIAIAAGSSHSLAIDSDGQVWSWGYDGDGQLGNGAPGSQVVSPALATTDTTYTGIAAGELHSLAIRVDGKLAAWGSDAEGQTGNGATSGIVTSPVRIGGTTTITGIAFDGVPGTGLQRLSESTALVTTPAGTPGDAVVTIAYSYDGTPRPTLTYARAFTYLAPAPPAPTTPPAPPSPAKPPASPPVAPGPGSTADTPVFADAGDVTTVGEDESPTVTADATPEPTDEPAASPSASPDPASDDDAPASEGSWTWLWVALVTAALVTFAAIALRRRASQ